MPYTITLRSASAGERVIGGVTFVDGSATVESIGDSRRAYFDAMDARVEDISVPQPQSAEEVAELTISQLTRLAASHGIEHSSRTRQARLASLISAKLFPEES